MSISSITLGFGKAWYWYMWWNTICLHLYMCVSNLVFGAAFSVPDVLGNNPLHLLSQHRVLSQLWAQGTVQHWTVWVEYINTKTPTTAKHWHTLTIHTNDTGTSYKAWTHYCHALYLCSLAAVFIYFVSPWGGCSHGLQSQLHIYTASVSTPVSHQLISPALQYINPGFHIIPRQIIVLSTSVVNGLSWILNTVS